MNQNYVLAKIKYLLDQRKWSLSKLAQETGIPYSSLNSLFQKNNQPTIATLEKICAGFHITISQFFADDMVDLPICDFSREEIEIINKIRGISTHDKRLLMSLLDTMEKKRLNSLPQTSICKLAHKKANKFACENINIPTENLSQTRKYPKTFL